MSSVVVHYLYVVGPETNGSKYLCPTYVQFKCRDTLGNHTNCTSTMNSKSCIADMAIVPEP